MSWSNNIEPAPSYSPGCGTEYFEKGPKQKRTHEMVFCYLCGPEEVWCATCHGKICGGCYEDLGDGTLMNHQTDSLFNKECRFLKNEGAPCDLNHKNHEQLCKPCQKKSAELKEIYG